MKMLKVTRLLLVVLGCMVGPANTATLNKNLNPPTISLSTTTPSPTTPSPTTTSSTTPSPTTTSSTTTSPTPTMTTTATTTTTTTTTTNPTSTSTTNLTNSTDPTSSPLAATTTEDLQNISTTNLPIVTDDGLNITCDNSDMAAELTFWIITGSISIIFNVGLMIIIVAMIHNKRSDSNMESTEIINMPTLEQFHREQRSAMRNSRDSNNSIQLGIDVVTPSISNKVEPTVKFTNINK